MQLMSAEVRTG